MSSDCTVWPEVVFTAYFTGEGWRWGGREGIWCEWSNRKSSCFSVQSCSVYCGKRKRERCMRVSELFNVRLGYVCSALLEESRLRLFRCFSSRSQLRISKCTRAHFTRADCKRNKKTRRRFSYQANESAFTSCLHLVPFVSFLFILADTHTEKEGKVQEARDEETQEI